jgi:hypothetical protein
LEISLSNQDILVSSLLVIAFVIPIVTIIQIHPDGIDLQLNYQYSHSLRRGDSGASTTYADYDISSVAKLDNLSLVLDMEVREYPVWMNVSSWSLGDAVQIGDQIVTIVGTSDRNELDCWVGELQNGTEVYYSREFGVFLGTYWHDFDFIGMTYYYSETRKIELTYQNLMELYRVEYEFNIDAIVISIIIIESAALIWFYESGRIDVLLRKS